jgi:hypothetical protein
MRLYVGGEGGVVGKTASPLDSERGFGAVDTAHTGTEQRKGIFRIKIDGVCLEEPPGIDEGDLKLGPFGVEGHSHYLNQVGPSLREIPSIESALSHVPLIIRNRVLQVYFSCRL